MSTDFQHARTALGARLRELRVESGLTGRELADALGWPQSKVSKLETGRQTATVDDLRAWAEGTGYPEAADGLAARLRGLESRTRSWRRQLAAGHRPVQDAINAEHERSTALRGWVPMLIPGILQTADYARRVFSAFADLHQCPRDLDAAVQGRLKRQEALYRRGKHYHILMWEPALRMQLCPPAVLVAQLDRLSGVIGLDTVSLGVVPCDAHLKIPPGNDFWIHDERLVVVEDWHAELWLDDAQNIALYLKIWETLNSSAVYGADAQQLITRARRALDESP
ncbi:helix-turn-helix domain-containing protein [Streptantibioticus ferralitis]|uniref:Helix-turn-helix transcriptional regulator n=1 Tax=Streptantibioticus ferralitis TaxID=236510 RepID=A0ABT5YW59_9ACTN|nr:helix-turn-helix transcriptional regulator [Streptantibioticus ferralitis]MDF2255779.1 helix-turn-helix transcriptional regulator [Streptantibioticus ferralitis]